MRLIDADEFLAKETQAYNNVKLELSGKNDQMSAMTRAVNECVHQLFHLMVNGEPTAKKVDDAAANKMGTEGSR